MSRPSAPDGTELSLPDGWALDWIAVDRLARQLAAAPDSVAAVAASTGPLAPGASYRTHAERLALRPMSDTELVEASPPPDQATLMWRGAPPGPWTARAPRPDGRVLVDHGAHVHVPGPGAIGPTTVASPEGRPPFPVRPVVLFVHTADEPLDVRVLALVNNLLPLDVEARLATPTVPAGRHLTSPCAPELASLRALVPDVVVPTDEGARRLIDEWAATGVSACSVELDDGGPDHEVLGWDRGPSGCPVRARINPDVEVRVLARLVLRLASGPQPLQPGQVGVG